MPARRSASQLAAFVQGDGLYLYDAQGNRTADFTSASGQMLLGYSHPVVIKAVQQQAEVLWSTPARSIAQAELDFHTLLESVAPSHLTNFFCVETASKAVERAVLLAQRATLRSRVLVFDGGAHGDTIQTLAMSAVKGGQRAHPGVSSVLIAPYPTSSTEDEIAFCLRQLERMFKTQTAPENIAAMVIEPMLEQGGGHVTPPAFFKALEGLCRRWGILLIVNEARSSLRGGEWLMSVGASVQPDMVVLSSGLANGLPLGVVAAADELGVHLEAHYPASTLAIAAAHAVVQTVKQQRLIPQAQAMGERLQGGLSDLQSEYGHIVEVRGRGLMLGVAFDAAERKVATLLVEACRQRGLWLPLWGSEDEVIGWMPPLTVTEAQIDDALGIFEEALQTVLLQRR
ncbi:MAG: aminotransferase class III-fold pyridoxal phosphate-dependent enzyme [Aggregatilineales bacterium]